MTATTLLLLKRKFSTEMEKIVIWNDALGLRMLASSVTEQAFRSKVLCALKMQHRWVLLESPQKQEEGLYVFKSTLFKKVKLEKLETLKP